MSCTKEHALTPHSGSSGVGGSGRRIGYMCRARNIGYIELLAGGGGLPPEGPLKGSPALESTDYIHLQGTREQESGRRENRGEKATHTLGESTEKKRRGGEGLGLNPGPSSTGESWRRRGVRTDVCAV